MKKLQALILIFCSIVFTTKINAQEVGKIVNCAIDDATEYKVITNAIEELFSKELNSAMTYKVKYVYEADGIFHIPMSIYEQDNTHLYCEGYLMAKSLKHKKNKCKIIFSEFACD